LCNARSLLHTYYFSLHIGGDYSSISTILTFEAGETDQIVTVTTLEDTVNEADETFVVSLSNPTGGGTIGSSGLSTITIQDDDSES